MLHLLYILAFTVLALIAISNLIRNLIMFSCDGERTYPSRYGSGGNRTNLSYSTRQMRPHPELLDTSGNLIKEPLLVMRSVNVDDAREQLDALYESSPGSKSEKREEG